LADRRHNLSRIADRGFAKEAPASAILRGFGIADVEFALQVHYEFVPHSTVERLAGAF